VTPGEIFEMGERRDGETVVLVLTGELDLDTVGDVEQRLAELRTAGRTVRLDLDGLTFMDSTGIRLLLSAAEDATREGWTFHVTRGSQQVQRVLSAAQVIERLPYSDGADGSPS
jgi:anti-sigma B factor antagonist